MADGTNDKAANEVFTRGQIGEINATVQLALSDALGKIGKSLVDAAMVFSSDIEELRKKLNSDILSAIEKQRAGNNETQNHEGKRIEVTINAPNLGAISKSDIEDDIEETASREYWVRKAEENRRNSRQSIPALACPHIWVDNAAGKYCSRCGISKVEPESMRLAHLGDRTRCGACWQLLGGSPIPHECRGLNLRDEILKVLLARVLYYERQAGHKGGKFRYGKDSTLAKKRRLENVVVDYSFSTDTYEVFFAEED